MAKSLASHISSNSRSQFGEIKIGASLLELMLLKRPKGNTKCVSAAGEELTAAKHKLKLLELKLFRDAAAAHMK
nr:hypothetical protein [Tanacetum cinerariifolium]